MPRSYALLFALATLSASASAQVSDPAVTPSTSTYLQAQPAPIEHHYASEQAAAAAPAARAPRNMTTQPLEGVWLTAGQHSAVKTVSADANGTEIRVESGRANVAVYHPASNVQILVDLPGGQTAILKDGLYTFNAQTNTVRVVKGEAEGFVGTSDNAIKLKENHEIVFTGAAKAAEVDEAVIHSDILPGAYANVEGQKQYASGYYGGGYGEGFYGDDFGYGYPGYGFGGPWGWGYPGYGGGYPYGYGFGIGYYGGFGGFRGGYRGGGFRGHR